MSKVNKPILGITLGDPGGIGTEVTLKALAMTNHDFEHAYLYGSPLSYQHPLMLPLCQALPKDKYTFVALTSNNGYLKSNPTAFNGDVAYQAVCRAVADIQKGVVDVLVTAPLSKQSLILAGCSFLGHTYLLRSLAQVSEVWMGFYTPYLKVVLVTIHVPLRDVPRLVTSESILSAIEAATRWHSTLEHRSPRIAVAGLNPHAGEEGTIGDEEVRIVQPAIDMARQKGLNVQGPISPDIVFLKAYEKEYDLVIALYHDQGLIPVKLLAFYDAVNVTIGLPFIRTSPDHGTAFDKAYKDEANPSSMVAAISLAIRMFHG